jgi:hypothetical protein
MNKEFIPYEQALALKELGFDFEDYDILGFYSKKYGVTTQSQLTKKDEYNPAPIYQQAFRFFREKYGLHMYPTKFDETKWWIEWGTWTSKVFNTFEEAELECLKKLIELSKNK